VGESKVGVGRQYGRKMEEAARRLTENWSDPITVPSPAPERGAVDGLRHDVPVPKVNPGHHPQAPHHARSPRRGGLGMLGRCSGSGSATMLPDAGISRGKLQGTALECRLVLDTWLTTLVVWNKN